MEFRVHTANYEKERQRRGNRLSVPLLCPVLRDENEKESLCYLELLTIIVNSTAGEDVLWLQHSVPCQTEA